jgi:hypothetical protein
MAAEVTVGAALESDNGVATIVGPTISGQRFDQTGVKYIRTVQAVGTSEEAMQLGETSGSLGWCLLKNLDNTNFVKVLTGTGGTVFAKLLPKGGCALFYFGSGVTAPFVQSDTAACNIEILILAQ